MRPETTRGNDAHGEFLEKLASAGQLVLAALDSLAIYQSSLPDTIKMSSRFSQKYLQLPEVPPITTVSAPPSRTSSWVVAPPLPVLFTMATSSSSTRTANGGKTGGLLLSIRGFSCCEYFHTSYDAPQLTQHFV